MSESLRMLRICHPEVPEFLRRMAETPPMLRLRQVGMNCGCEYTSLPMFRNLPRYSRWRHSVGTALIVWHFTGDRAQSAAALLHDIATPVFAHTVDFLRGDYLRQEATEAHTAELIAASPELGRLLAAEGLTLAEVEDYHRYPIADNDSPRLSADRLEYTLGNMALFGFGTPTEAEELCGRLRVTEAPDGQPELAFADRGAAERFAFLALRCARVYVSDQDRYAMQRLSEVLRAAAEKGVLREEDLWSTEPEVIGLLEANPATRTLWQRFRALHRMRTDDAAPQEDRRVVPAKKRWIDPLVCGEGRLSGLSEAFRREKDAFLAESQDDWICAE